MALDHDLLDRIYEAAAIPELWPAALEDMSAVADGRAASLVAYSAAGDVGHLSSPAYRPAYDDYLANGTQFENIRPRRVLERQYPGFLSDLEVCTPEELRNDDLYLRFLRPHGLQWTAGTVIVSASGDMLVIDVASGRGAEPFTRAHMERLDDYRPHLARGTLLASRLGLRAARNMTDAMQLLGLPAAALSRSGRVVALNPLAEALDGRFQFRSFDRITLASKPADALLAEALAGTSDTAARSIPLPASVSQPALIIHLVPVRGAANDVFASAHAIMLITAVGATQAPTAELLSGLFDLTPAEARVARALASGLALEPMAAQFGVSLQTVRNQLRSVFAKTGTARQSELLTLIAGTMPFRQPPAGGPT